MATPAHDHPKAAPDELDLVRLFVNTYDVEEKKESLSDPETTAAWLAEHELLPPGQPLTHEDVRQAQAMREAFRKLLLAHNGSSLDQEAVDAVNAAAKSAELVVHFEGDGDARLAPVRPGIDGALGQLVAIAYRAMECGTWERLKACADPTCEWAFYDWSKNRSGAWCDMAVCGNRAKARAFRERRSGSAT